MWQIELWSGWYFSGENNIVGPVLLVGGDETGATQSCVGPPGINISRDLTAKSTTHGGSPVCSRPQHVLNIQQVSQDHSRPPPPPARAARCDINHLMILTIISLTSDSNTALEVRSNINFQTSNIQQRHYNKYRDRRRTGGKHKNFRSLFGSDCEDEITSVVSDNPQLYHRSASMVSLPSLRRRFLWFPEFIWWKSRPTVIWETEDDGHNSI